MKKILLAVITVMLTITRVSAQEYNLYIEAVEGTTSNWTLSELKKLTFQNNNVVFNMKNGTMTSTPISGIKRMFISTPEEQSITTIEGKKDFIWDGSALTVTAPQGESVSVYRADGVLVKKTTLDYSNTVSLEQLQKGMYIISINGRNHKVFKK